MEDTTSIGLAVAMGLGALELAKVSVSALSAAIKKKTSNGKIEIPKECPVHGNCVATSLAAALEQHGHAADKSNEHLASISGNIRQMLENQKEDRNTLKDIKTDTNWLTALDEAKARTKARSGT